MVSVFKSVFVRSINKSKEKNQEVNNFDLIIDKKNVHSPVIAELKAALTGWIDGHNHKESNVGLTNFKCVAITLLENLLLYIRQFLEGNLLI